MFLDHKLTIGKDFKMSNESQTAVVEKQTDSESKYLSPIVNTNQTNVSVIPARDGLWSAVRLRWRKLTAEQIETIVVRAAADDEGGRVRHAATIMAGQRDEDGQLIKPGNVIDWDIRDTKGKKLPVTAEAIRDCDYLFYLELLAVVCGERPQYVQQPKAA
jgi:hypothetical protein